jgi:3-dehydroquinate dehydratase
MLDAPSPEELELEPGDVCLVTVRATWNGSTWALKDGTFLKTTNVIAVSDVEYLVPGTVD